MGETDKELLELAAKAAGIALAEQPFIHSKDPGALTPGGSIWNPLTDDGDALRLAVKLNLIVCSHRQGESWAQRLEINIKEAHGDDAVAATRRAIVRAAAATARHTEGA
ncbi:hypothetical protein V8Z80_08280 [Orrella sp. JC864]|uniref:hypothetical protein n=1 Tax=Orrella sp. JC864 TaxID=3120298 RepID=UPI00300B061E